MPWTSSSRLKLAQCRVLTNVKTILPRRKKHRSKNLKGGETRPLSIYRYENMTDDFDFSVFEQIPVDKEAEASLENLVKNAEEMAELKGTIESIEGTLSELTKQYNYIAQEVIPEMLDELGLKTFELKDGSKITVKDFISGSLPKDEQRFEQAIEWLKENDLESILKTDVSMKFGKGEDNFVKNVVAL